MTQIISLVAAMNQDKVIGANNQLPWHIPEDLKLFKQATWGKPIVMGRKTFASLGRPLAGRNNIVISRSQLTIAGITSYLSLTDALQANADAPEICIIGGGEIFKESLPLANKLYLTMVDLPVLEEPCAWFPEIDFALWQLVEQQDFTSTNGIICSYRVFLRISTHLYSQ